MSSNTTSREVDILGMTNVLFANADPKLIQLYHPYLTRHFFVDSANDGLTALRKLKLTRPNVIISDYQLPRLSGLGLLKFVRSQENLAATPFIFFTNRLNIREALSFAANDWLNLSLTTPDLLIEKIYYHLKLN